MWEAKVFTARDGKLYSAVSPDDFPWSTSLVGDGKATATFVVDELPRPPADLFMPNARYIALHWGTFVAFYGKVERFRWSRDRRTVVVEAVEFEVETKWRMTYGVANYGDGTLVIPGRNESGTIARVMQRFMNWGAGWAYPVDLPADAPGDVNETWEYWRKFRIADLIAYIRDRGFEVYFRPYFTGDGDIRLQTRVARRITLGTSSFHLQAEETPIRGVEYTVDGASQLTGVQGLGNGSGADQETSYAWAMAGEDIPFRDARIDFPDLTGAALQAAASAALTEDRNAIAQWSVPDFVIGDGWGPEDAAVGRVWQIEVWGDPVIPSGTHTLRVIRASGNLGNVISTEVQSAA